MRKKQKQNKERDIRSGQTYALIYCRVSSMRQTTDGHGLDSQEIRCRQFATQRKCEVEKVFKDSFTGGGDFMKRPAMNELLTYVNKNAHRKYVLIFDDLKRFARDVAKHWELRHLFQKLGIDLLSPNFEFKEDSEEGWLHETMSAVFNEYEKRTNTRQVVEKMEARLLGGHWPFGTKRGYESTVDPEFGKLPVPKVNDAQLLKEALEGFASGIFVKKIDACRFLVNGGFWKRKRPEKYVYQFDRLLRDPFYAGYIEYPKWEVPRRIGHHKALISLETFEINQRRLDKTVTVQLVRKDVSEDFPMRGLQNCDDCGKHQTASWTKGNGGRYGFYFCQNKACRMYRKSINKDVVHKGFKALLGECILKPEVKTLVHRVFDEVWKEEINNYEKLQAQKVINKILLEERVEKLANNAVNATSDVLKSTYEQQIEKTVSELKEVEASLIETPDLKTPYQTALDKAVKMLESPYKIWESVSLEEKHSLFFFLFEEKLPYSKTNGYPTEKILTATKLFEDFVIPTKDFTNDVHLPGLEPGTTDPKSVMISISLQVHAHLRTRNHTLSQAKKQRFSATMPR
jgi:site-specific DNA recombinase